MITESNRIREEIASSGLKVTLQRVIVLSSLYRLRTHPTAENLIKIIRTDYPDIAIGTIYNILDTFTEKGLARKVKTDGDVMRYDVVSDRHHHLYYRDSDRIADYYDEEISMILEEYFRNRKIPDFDVEKIELHITGHHKDDR